MMLQYDDATQVSLREFCLDHDLDITKNYDKEDRRPDQFHFHTTLFFSEAECTHPLADGEFDIGLILTIPDHYEMLGENGDILTLCLKPNLELNALRTTFNRNWGLKDSWPTYKPHITLSYSHPSKILPEMFPPTDLLGTRLKITTIK